MAAQPSLIDKNLEHALIDRKQCLRSHPLYAENTNTNSKTSNVASIENNKENTKENSNAVKTTSMIESNHQHSHDGSVKRTRKIGR